jgi:hypothetical protein
VHRRQYANRSSQASQAVPILAPSPSGRQKVGAVNRADLIGHYHA